MSTDFINQATRNSDFLELTVSATIKSYGRGDGHRLHKLREQ